VGRRLILLALTTIASIASCAVPAFAAPGALDPSFGAGGFATSSPGTLSVAGAAVVQPDGKIVTAGEAQTGGKKVLISTRINPDGKLDTSYGGGGTATVDINGSSCGNALALQPDGKIVIAGTGIDGGTGGMAFAAVRLLPNGGLDSGFGHGGIVTVPIGSGAIANAVAVQPDGKIVLGGTALLAHNEFAAARLNPDGSIDPSFGTGGISTLAPPAAAWGMVLQPDGKLVLAGEQSDGGGQAFMAARLRADGSPDPGFGTGGAVTVPIGSTAIANAVALQTDGKIVLAGNAFTSTGVAATVRLLSSGSLDQSFGSGGIATTAMWKAINAIAIQPDGKLLLGATGASAVRLNTDGSLDQGFGNGGIATAQLGDSTDAANGVTVQRDGKIVLSGCAHVAGQTVLSVIRLAGDATSTGSTPGPATQPGPSSHPSSSTRPKTKRARNRRTAPRRDVLRSSHPVPIRHRIRHRR
jgi:uncharacterized delta-60 repeat protein